MAGKKRTAEEKRERFITLCEKRMNAALSNINLIGNLSNKSNYEYNENDVKQIFGALKNAIKENEKRFSATATREGKALFNLKL